MLALVGESDGESEGRKKNHTDYSFRCFLTYYYFLVLNFEVAVIISSSQLEKPYKF